jgi:hypothetical protein
MAQITISENTPEIVYPTLLALDENQIANACQELLQFLDLPAQEPFRVKYRLELLPNQNGKILATLSSTLIYIYIY